MKLRDLTAPSPVVAIVPPSRLPNVTGCCGRVVFGGEKDDWYVACRECLANVATSSVAFRGPTLQFC